MKSRQLLSRIFMNGKHDQKILLIPEKFWYYLTFPFNTKNILFHFHLQHIFLLSHPNLVHLGKILQPRKNFLKSAFFFPMSSSKVNGFLCSWSRIHLNFTFYTYIGCKDYCAFRIILKQGLTKMKFMRTLKHTMSHELQ